MFKNGRRAIDDVEHKERPPISTNSETTIGLNECIVAIFKNEVSNEVDTSHRSVHKITAD